MRCGSRRSPFRGLGKGGDDPVIESLSVTANGTYTAGEGVDGYSPVTVALPLTEKTITENGVYAPTTSAGYDMVNVNVPFYPREDVPLELLTSAESMEMHTEPTIGTRYYPIVYLAAIHYPAATGEEYVNVGKYFAPTDANYSVTTYIDIIDKETGESVEGFPQRTNTGASFGINSGGYIRLKGWYVTVSNNHVKVNVITTRWNTTYSKPLDDTYATQTDLETWLSAYTTPPYVIKDDRWAVVDSGSCGTNATYKLYGNGLLEISGTGAIAQQAFAYRDDIVNVVVGDGITEIGRLSFIGCENITSVILPDSITVIDGRAFEECISLASINIPDGVTSIGDTTFYDCTSLTSITLSESLTSIDGLAFGGCTALTEVTVPAATPPTIGNDPFYGCTALTAIYVPAASVEAYKTAWSSYANQIQPIPEVIETGSCGTDATYELWDTGLLEISGTGSVSGAPWDASKVKSVLISEGITAFANKLFYDPLHSNLRSAILPSTLSNTGSETFRGTGLTSVVIPEGVTSIGWRSFRGCSYLTSVTLPSTITSIANGGFQSCAMLASMTVLATEPPTLSGADALPSTSVLQAIYVPAASVDAYKTAWSSRASMIQAIQE